MKVTLRKIRGASTTRELWTLMEQYGAENRLPPVRFIEAADIKTLVAVQRLCLKRMRASLTAKMALAAIDRANRTELGIA